MQKVKNMLNILDSSYYCKRAVTITIRVVKDCYHLSTRSIFVYSAFRNMSPR